MSDRDDVGDDTDRERRVVCVCCGGTGLPNETDAPNWRRCPWCNSLGWTTLGDALAWLRAMLNGDAGDADIVACPSCRGSGARPSDLATCIACAGIGRVSTAQAVAILDRMTLPPPRPK